MNRIECEYTLKKQNKKPKNPTPNMGGEIPPRGYHKYNVVGGGVGRDSMASSPGPAIPQLCIYLPGSMGISIVPWNGLDAEER